MQVDIKKALKTPWDRIANNNLDRLPFLSAGEQTKGSWAKEIESSANVPDIYKEFYSTHLDDETSFPYTVITPTFKGFIYRENEKLICCKENKIFVLENANNQLTSVCYTIEDINYIEAGTILLKSWITISGKANNGILSTSTLRFNSVTEYMFYPFIDKIRSAVENPSSNGSSAELSKFDYLSEVDFKFMNYARNSIMPGDQIVAHVFQPEIRTKYLALFGKGLYRTLVTTHIGILTDKELIIIQDTGIGRMNTSKRYGGIRYYIPLGKICSVSLSVKAEDLLELSITLSADDHIHTLFSVTKKPEVERLLKKISDLIPGEIVSLN